jgi:hypothetical protein
MQPDTKPILSPSAICWFELAQWVTAASLIALLTLIFDRVNHFATLICALVGTVSIVTGSTRLLCLWARWEGRPLTSDREWFARRDRVLNALPVSLIRGMLVGLVTAQVATQEPPWSLGSRGWLTVVSFGLFSVLISILAQVCVMAWSWVRRLFSQKPR